MQRDWLVYGTGPRRARQDRIYATLNRKGLILLNRMAFEELDRPQAVEVLLDKRNSAVGLRPTDRDLAHAYPIRRLSSSFGLMCKQFCTEYGIRFDTTVQFPTARIEHGVLILELKYRVPATRTRRPCKPAS